MPAKKKIKSKLPKKVVDYLKKAGVPHDVIEHKTVYTAYDAAQTMGKKMSEIAKSLLVKADKDYFVVIVPADQNIDMDKLKKAIGKTKGKAVKTVMIPGEKIMANLLKLKNETVSAFGQMHKLPVLIDKKMAKAKKAVFSSGGFNHAVEMKVKDFMNLEKAQECSCSAPKKKAKPASAKATAGKKAKAKK